MRSSSSCSSPPTASGGGLRTGRGLGRGRRPSSSRLGAGMSAAGDCPSAMNSASSLSDNDRPRFFDVRLPPRPRPRPVPEPLPPPAEGASSPVVPVPSALAFPLVFALPSLFFLLFAGRFASESGSEPLLSPSPSALGVVELRSLACCFLKSDTTCCSRLLVYACRLRGAAFAPRGTSKYPARLPCALADAF